MKHLPNSPPTLTNSGSLPMDIQTDFIDRSAQVAATASMKALPVTSQGSFTSAAPFSTSLLDLPNSSNEADSKRDPRRDPHLLDPRRVPLEVPTQPIKEEAISVQPCLDSPVSSNIPVSLPVTPHVEKNSSTLLSSQPLVDGDIVGGSLANGIDHIMPKNEEMNEAVENQPAPEISVTRDFSLSSLHAADEKTRLPILPDVAPEETIAASMEYESDEHSPSVPNTSASEESCHDFPPVPSYVELSFEQEHTLREGAVKRVVGSHEKIESSGYCQTRMAVLARLVSQVIAGDHVTSLLQEGLILDFQHQQGHELLYKEAWSPSLCF